MKTILFTITFAFSLNAVFAQTYNLKIKQGSGTTYSVTSTVDEITFVNTTTTPFVCGDVILYGGETYPTVLIGSQCWFQKNLNIGTKIAGSSNQTNNSVIQKYCYDNLDASCTTYGGLYQWNEAMNYNAYVLQGICPEGWHIPTPAEFTTLKTVVSNDGNKLKALGEGTGSGTGTNTSGFSALLAGERILSGTFSYCGNNAFFCSSGQLLVPPLVFEGQFMELDDNSSNIGIFYSDKGYGYSVRCIKD